MGRRAVRYLVGIGTAVALLAASGCAANPSGLDLDANGKVDLIWMTGGTIHQTLSIWHRQTEAGDEVILPASGSASTVYVPGNYAGTAAWEMATIAHGFIWRWYGSDQVIEFARPGPEYVQPATQRYYQIPVPGYYDAGSMTVPAWYDEFTGTWTIKGHDPVVFGAGPSDPTDTPSCDSGSFDHDWPVPADYDGDRKTDLAVYNPASGLWRIRNSKDLSVRELVLGGAGDLPAAADYDGNGIVEPAVLRTGGSERGMWQIDGQAPRNFGDPSPSDDDDGDMVPAPADYVGGTGADLAYVDLVDFVVSVQGGPTVSTVNSTLGFDVATVPIAAEYNQPRSVYFGKECVA